MSKNGYVAFDEVSGIGGRKSSKTVIDPFKEKPVFFTDEDMQSADILTLQDELKKQDIELAKVRRERDHYKAEAHKKWAAENDLKEEIKFELRKRIDEWY